MSVPVAGAAGASRPAAVRASLGVRVGIALAIPIGLVAALSGVALGQAEGQAVPLVLGLALVALAVQAACAAWIMRRVVAPIEPVMAAVERISLGDLAAGGDLGRAGELRRLVQAVERVRGRLHGVVGQVRIGTTNVAMNAAQIARDNAALSARTDTQAESLQETAASMEELTATVRHNAGTAQQAHALALSASERAAQGGQVMQEVVATMGTIRSGSHSIREIIGVIDGIAFQTNILALNAAVEAARAGEQGRGFAVVAAEVRNLAQRSAAAAREIKDLIGASVAQVDAGGQRVDQAGRAMGEIVAAVRQVAELIGHINGASQEQSSGIETVNTAVARIDTTTHENAAFVRAAAQTAAALQERAVTLLQSVQGFSLGALEHADADAAVTLVAAGCEFARAHGRAALEADVNLLDNGRFIDRDLYLMVLGVDDATFTAHGNNPGRIGTGPKVKDVDGRCFPAEFARVARDRGEGWVDYKWVHPVTNEVFGKSGYVRRIGDHLVACAIYKR